MDSNSPSSFATEYGYDDDDDVYNKSLYSTFVSLNFPSIFDKDDKDDAAGVKIDDNVVADEDIPLIRLLAALLRVLRVMVV